MRRQGRRSAHRSSARRTPLPHRRRPIHRRRELAEPDARVFPALAARARADPQASTRRSARRRRAWSPIFTGADLDGVNGLPCGWLITGTDGKPMKEPPHPLLAQGKVRYVGDQVALVIAETRDQAKDAAELIDVDYEVLPAVVNVRRRAEAGRAAGARRGAGQQVLHVGARRQGGGRRGVRQGRARDEARHRQQPPHPQRDRAARRASRRTAAADDGYTLYVANQNPHVERLLMTAFVLGLPEHKVRVIAPDVGGGFGSKIYLYAEETAMVWAAKRVEPADQVDGRAQRSVPLRRARPRPRDARGARARQGRQVPRDARARRPRTWAPTCRRSRRASRRSSTRRCSPGQYTTPAIYCEVTAVVHQHGAGRRLSRRGTAGSDLRRRAARAPGGASSSGSRRTRSGGATSSASFPYQTPVALLYDTGDYDATLDEAMKIADVDGFRGAQGGGRRSAASSAASATRRTSRPAASRRRTSRARSARARACSKPAKCACIRPAG